MWNESNKLLRRGLKRTQEKGRNRKKHMGIRTNNETCQEKKKKPMFNTHTHTH